MYDMEKLTKERELTAKEIHIKNLINSKDERFVSAFSFIQKHYRIDYILGKSNHYLVFKAIYISNIDIPKWKMAICCHVSRTTLFVYRHDIIKCFNTYINENLLM